MRANRFPSLLSHFSLMQLVFAAGLLLAITTNPLPAHAQADCTVGRDCCVVGMDAGPPRRYAVVCDSPAQNAINAASMSGYKFVAFGPASWARCGAWMANAGIPGWSQYVDPRYKDVAPKPDTSCMPGKNCCYIGSTYDNPPQYAIGYDGQADTGIHALFAAGFRHIVYGPVSDEACHAYWNEHIAAAGFGTPIGAVPLGRDRATRGQGPRPPIPGGTGGGGISLILNSSTWVRAANYIGIISASQAGLHAQGGPWTNGRLANGVYDGNRLQSRDSIDLSSGGDIYAAFSVDGAGAYMVFWPRLLTGTGVPAFSTHHSWANSIVVSDRSMLYGHLRVNPGGTYLFTIAAGGYDDAGGRLLHRSQGRLTNPVGVVDFQFGDNYAGNRASLTINEVWVYRDGAVAGGEPSVGMLRPPGARRPPGSACSTSEDCDNSVCLLGVCAPPSNPQPR